MYEQSKSARRRYFNGAFHSRYFVGSGLDIGAGTDSIKRFAMQFRGITAIRSWDLPDGDAQYLESIYDNTYDFVQSSHCLEHMVNVKEALLNWVRVVKPSGYLVITVPDEDMYEQGVWPSRFNQDHKHTFTMSKRKSWSPVSINVLGLLTELSDVVKVDKVERLEDFFSHYSTTVDQTLLPNPECAIEFILQKL